VSRFETYAEIRPPDCRSSETSQVFLHTIRHRNLADEDACIESTLRRPQKAKAVLPRAKTLADKLDI
jgi:hypothetical protein